MGINTGEELRDLFFSDPEFVKYWEAHQAEILSNPQALWDKISIEPAYTATAIITDDTIIGIIQDA